MQEQQQIWNLPLVKSNKIVELIRNKLEIFRLNSGLECKVIQAATRIRHYLFPYQGYISAALILGGVDSNGPQLYNIYPHGSGNELPFATMGSGSLAAMSMLETEYRDEMTVNKNNENRRKKQQV